MDKIVHDPEDIANFIAWYRGKASSVAALLGAADSKTAEGFLTGAQQPLAPFNITTRAHKIMSRSSFRFADMRKRKKPTTVFIVIDASRMATQSMIAGLLQWSAQTELKRHPAKHKPVYFIADEATNFKIHDLPSLQTWGREYGIRWHGFIQSMSAYRSTYGQEGLNVMLSETEIKQFLPGQRDPELLELIVKLLGDQSIMARTHSAQRDTFGINSTGYQEDGKPLMTADEIRRTDKTILLIRKCRPVLTKTPPIAAIHPWRTQVGINPFYGKRYLKRVTLRIGHRKGVLILRPFRWIASKIKAVLP